MVALLGSGMSVAVGHSFGYLFVRHTGVVIADRRPYYLRVHPPPRGLAVGPEVLPAGLAPIALGSALEPNLHHAVALASRAGDFVGGGLGEFGHRFVPVGAI